MTAEEAAFIMMSGGSSPGLYADIFGNMPTIWGTHTSPDGWYVLVKVDTEECNLGNYYYYGFYGVTESGTTVAKPGEYKWRHGIYGAVYYRGDFVYAAKLNYIPAECVRRRWYNGEMYGFFPYEFYVTSFGFTNVTEDGLSLSGTLHYSTREISRYTDTGEIFRDNTYDRSSSLSLTFTMGTYQPYDTGYIYSDISDVWELGEKIAAFRAAFGG